MSWRACVKRFGLIWCPPCAPSPPAALLGLALLAGCGGAGGGASSATSTHASAATPPGGHAVAAGPRVVLHAPTHTPRANAPWVYSISAHDVDGRPLPGVARVEFTFVGQVVGRDTPLTHRFVGAYHELLRWPAKSEGYPLAFQATVHTSEGTRTLVYQVHVRP